MVMLYSSKMTQGGKHFLAMQLVWCGIGLVACFIAATLDYRWLKKLAVPLLICAILLLGLVLIPQIGGTSIGHKANGARRWFSFGRVSFQPSEFAKLALIIALAWYGHR